MSWLQHSTMQQYQKFKASWKAFGRSGGGWRIRLLKRNGAVSSLLAKPTCLITLWRLSHYSKQSAIHSQVGKRTRWCSEAGPSMDAWSTGTSIGWYSPWVWITGLLAWSGISRIRTPSSETWYIVRTIGFQTSYHLQYAVSQLGIDEIKGVPQSDCICG